MPPEVVAAPALDPPEAEPDTMVEPPAPASKKASAKKDKGAKKDKAGASGQGAEGAPTVAAHPRAVRSIARAKGWAGLVGFLIGGYMSLPTSTLAGAGARALVAGVVCYVVVWGAAVFAWRRLVILEIKAREQELMEQVKKAAEGRAAAAATAGPRAGARDAT
ncbi:MAG: hypothetical protein ACLQBB_05745 [Solirubrobacteraceae bacterium]